MAAAATPSPEGRSMSLCLFSSESSPSLDEALPPRPVELHLDLATVADDRRITVSPLPDLHQADPLTPTRPISAAGHLWAPYFTERYPSRLVMRRLDTESGRWVRAGAAIHPPQQETSDCALHGYAVVRDTVILLSLQPPHLFLAFDCSTCAWNVVATDENELYVPIDERGVYVEEDDTIYALCGSTVYAYKLCHDDQEQNQYWMAPPIFVEQVSPFQGKGSGILTHLGARVMCLVCVPFHQCELRCSCDTLHVLITSFRVKSRNGSSRELFVPKGVRILHSTCRRVDIVPSESSSVDDWTFRFLQEYEELSNESASHSARQESEQAMKSSMLLEGIEVLTTSNVEESSKLLTCCRNFLNDMPFKKTIMFDFERSAVQTEIALYIICQAPSRSTVYEVRILNGRLTCHDRILKPHCVMDTFVCDEEHDLMERPLAWHFVCDSRFIYVVPYKKGELHVCSLDVINHDILHTRRPADNNFPISLVLRVGLRIIAITDTLQVFLFLSDTHEWERIHAFESAVSEMKVNLSGYVVVSEESFMVSEAETSCCYLFDLNCDTWSIVKPYAEVKISSPDHLCFFGTGFFRGRSVFSEGFIYSCANGGLAAYEIIDLESSYCLGSRLNLRIPWPQIWEGNNMCLDYIGKDIKSGTIMFCVLQGNKGYACPGALSKDPVSITTIQVKTEKMPNGKWKPLVTGHVDAGTFFVEQDEGHQIWTNSCFAVAS